MRYGHGMLVVGIFALTVLTGVLLAEPRIAAAAGATAIDAGDYHTCAIINDGRVQCWGTNSDTQLGDGTSTARLRPVDVCAVGATPPCSPFEDDVLEDVVEVSAGYESTCAITSSDEVVCWGDNEFGQLGDGQECDDDNCPVPVYVCETGATTPCTPGNENILEGVVDISVAGGLPSGYHACAVIDDGGVKCWGDNSWGQLGDGTENERTTPVDVCATGASTPCTGNLLDDVVHVSAGEGHTCVLMSSSTVKCWGHNESGELGDGTFTERWKPVDVCETGASAPCTAGNENLLSAVSSIEAGGYASFGHTCAIVGEDDRAKCWGEDEKYPASSDAGVRLGDGDETGGAQSTPVDVCETGADDPPCVPADEDVLVDIVQISAGAFHTCVAIGDGTAKCWGVNGYGAGTLGDAADASIHYASSTPVDVCDVDAEAPCTPGNENVLTNVTMVAAGQFHSCALLTSGTVRCWGGNSYNGGGQLGDDTSTLSFTPVPTLIDTDRDGCADEREAQTSSGSEETGGKRDAANFYDFFDTPDGSNVRDGIVTEGDTSRVTARFGASGSPTGNPLTAPPASPAYHPAFDRGPPTGGGDAWDLTVGDGYISVGDINRAVVQEGHDCT